MRDALVRKWATTGDSGDIIRVGNIVNQARSATDYGRSLDRGITPEAPSRPPIDYTISAAHQEYAYRVVLQIRNQYTGRVRTSLGILRSDTPLSPDDVRSQAIAHSSELLRTSGSDPAQVDARIESIQSVRVVSAGRRPA